jgi:hypothetical protein
MVGVAKKMLFAINLFPRRNFFFLFPFFSLDSDNFKKSFMKACMCTRGKDFNGQLQFENSIFPRFGRSARSSEKFSAIAKSNFQKTKTTIVGKEQQSEAITNNGAAVLATTATTTPANTTSGDVDKCKNSVCIKMTAITIPNNHIETKSHNINGIKEGGQRTDVLHTDL